MLKRDSGQIQTSVLISPEFYHLCKLHNIKFSEALRVGVSLILAEKDVMGYDNRLNIVRKLDKIRYLLDEKSNELDELKQKLINKQK